MAGKKKKLNMGDVGNQRNIKVDEPKPGHLNITCSKCGKPITVTNEFGMFCKDLHGLKEAKAADKLLDKFLEQFL